MQGKVDHQKLLNKAVKDLESGGSTERSQPNADLPSPVSRPKKSEIEMQKSMQLHGGRMHQAIIPEEYEPRSTHGRSGFKWKPPNSTRQEPNEIESPMIRPGDYDIYAQR